LIELMLVLTILALGMAMTVPLLSKRQPGGALNGATAELRAALRDARIAAISGGRTVAFTGDPAGGYWLDRRHLRFGASSEASSGLRVATSGAAPILFYPTGGASGGRIELRGGGTAHRDFDIDAVTGRVALAP
jgi:general secretion pathway protein H